MKKLCFVFPPKKKVFFYGFFFNLLALALTLGPHSYADDRRLEEKTSAVAGLNVVTSLAQLGGIAQAVGGENVRVTVLIGPQDSPHTHTLTPGDARALQEADVVMWVGKNLESFLAKPVAVLAKPDKVLALSDLSHIHLLHIAEGGEPSHQADDNGYTESAYDPHLWLDLENAHVIATALAQKLSEQDPEHKIDYEARAEDFSKSLSALDVDVKNMLKPFQKTPFLLSHDALQYYESNHHLEGGVPIVYDPENPPSAARIYQMQKLIERKNIHCLLSEPQSSPTLYKPLNPQGKLKVGEINIESTSLPLSPTLYQDTYRQMTETIVDCLSKKE